jgi:hypothetical protein
VIKQILHVQHDSPFFTIVSHDFSSVLILYDADPTMDDFTMPWPSCCSCQVMPPSSTKWSDGFRQRFSRCFVDEDRKHMEKD